MFIGLFPIQVAHGSTALTTSAIRIKAHSKACSDCMEVLQPVEQKNLAVEIIIELIKFLISY